MIRIVGALSLLTLVAACGGSSYSSSNAANARYAPQSTPSVLFANGPIATACRSGGRKQASRARCGCVQAVANRSLTRAEQIRGAKFFNDPQSAQDTRQSDNSSNERFWKRWKAFGTDAGKLCT